MTLTTQCATASSMSVYTPTTGFEQGGNAVGPGPAVLSPVKHGVARRRRLVKAPNGRRVGSLTDQVGIAFGLVGDSEHCLDKGIERGSRLSLGRLDHHRLGY